MMPSTPTPDFAWGITMPPFEWHDHIREWFRFMCDTEPVSYSKETACWRVYRYDDVAYVEHDYATFSSENRMVRDSLFGMDPPRHRQLRSLVTAAFSARTVAQMAPRIAKIIRDLLRAPLERGEMDVMSEFAAPLPVKVVAAMLGLPLDEWKTLHKLSTAVITDIRTNAASDPRQVVVTYFAPIVEERQRKPGQDLISLLLAAEVDGQRLNTTEICVICGMFLVAGNVTTTQLLGNALLCFHKYPEAWQQLVQDRSLVASAIEEILRYLPPNRGLAENTDILEGRTATRDVMLENQLIHKGEKVNVSALSANFDERQFPDPERFDIKRTPNRHLSFGHGIHFCLGAPLARLEAKIALETMLENMPRWSIHHDTQLELIPSSSVFGVRRLPIVIGH